MQTSPIKKRKITYLRFESPVFNCGLAGSLPIFVLLTGRACFRKITYFGKIGLHRLQERSTPNCKNRLRSNLCLILGPAFRRRKKVTLTLEDAAGH